MKKTLFLALILSFTVFNSCTVDDTTADFRIEFLPIETVEIPTEFNFGETNTITVTYKRPTTCHSFSNFQYVPEDNNVRNVAVINFVRLGSDCETLEDDFKSESFSFSVLYTQTYTFKFWQGKDDNGQDMYLVYEVPVNN